ncbi:pantetheine-phosphate adenylyltransferase [Eubacterium uniforme]|uniref:Phosphopantetheine adenylyltransferase n=1 Tax=Eubacterium uniforme TaxID=39495 RepID=A0A1T4V661_9FIRM|nr:pantetheine-phosphate adenylyltransferase [Eubacterium uniforme]SKA60468.1 Phosphopantetheine adenylyltransferase [Eubacterium uniforme]HAH18707.1 pantetheine-phosphate adenylyltransferase [Eubacterium sp.]HAV90365.1 pantetheine-phosphate adenylyltransferase [Eubacterium sp.]
MTKAIYPGSFDPVTLGHLSIIERAAETFDEVIVAVLKNDSKKPLFSVSERVSMLEEVTSHIENVKILYFEGLLVDFANECGVNTIVRGLRAITDFEYELQMAQTNKALSHNIDTVFFTTDVEYSYLSSSSVREIAKFGGNIDKFVPESIISKVYEKYK